MDRDPGVEVPIDDIEAGIKSSDICLADITTDNPNVWFELGYAIAAKREVVLVCSDERKGPFPFDIQHRTVIEYSTESRRDFEDLQQKIESSIKARLARREKLDALNKVTSVSKVEGLDQHEIATLVSVAEAVDEPHEGVPAYEIRRAMENAGYKKIATVLGLKSLLNKEMLEVTQEEDYNGQPFMAYSMADKGMEWLFENRDTLTLRSAEGLDADEGFDPDDELPF